MQQEALRRTQEMQRRAQAVRNESEPRHEKPETPPPEPPKPEAEIPREKTENNTVFNKSPGHSISEKSASGGIFDTLFKDKEKTLILGIVLLLMDEKTDNSLIMALMYLLI